MTWHRLPRGWGGEGRAWYLRELYRERERNRRYDLWYWEKIAPDVEVWQYIKQLIGTGAGVMTGRQCNVL